MILDVLFHAISLGPAAGRRSVLRRKSKKHHWLWQLLWTRRIKRAMCPSRDLSFCMAIGHCHKRKSIHQNKWKITSTPFKRKSSWEARNHGEKVNLRKMNIFSQLKFLMLTPITCRCAANVQQDQQKTMKILLRSNWKRSRRWHFLLTNLQQNTLLRTLLHSSDLSFHPTTPPPPPPLLVLQC